MKNGLRRIRERVASDEDVRNRVTDGIREGLRDRFREHKLRCQFVVRQVIKVRHTVGRTSFCDQQYIKLQNCLEREKKKKKSTNLGEVLEKRLVFFPFQRLARKSKTHKKQKALPLNPPLI